MFGLSRIHRESFPVMESPFCAQPLVTFRVQSTCFYPLGRGKYAAATPVPCFGTSGSITSGGQNLQSVRNTDPVLTDTGFRVGVLLL